MKAVFPSDCLSWIKLPVLMLLLLVVFLSQPAPVVSSGNVTDATECTTSSGGCNKDKDGILLPVWRPFGPSTGQKVLRGAVYLLALCYMFLGVAIVADKFMAAIEVITSKEKEVIYTNAETGEKHVVSVRIWNETVSNLTLMALGSSAPEILLSCIEIVGSEFQAGDLGPGTIVGSAAFNLFVIIAICVIVIPNGEVRRIEHLRVFVCTATSSVLAYIWLYLIIAVITPEKVDVWEAVITFAFFPLLVGLAYIADKRLIHKIIFGKRYSAEKIEKFDDHDMEMAEKNGSSDKNDNNYMKNDKVNKNSNHASNSRLTDSNIEQYSAQEENKRDYIKKLEEVRKQNPDWSDSRVSQQAALDILAHQKKSRAYYRVATTRKMTGGGNIVKKNLEKRTFERENELNVVIENIENFSRVAFEPPNYTVMENVGSFDINVQRIPGEEDKNLDFYTYVDYKTVEGSAKRDTDFKYQEGTLVFEPKQDSKTIAIEIIDDEDFEEDEHFKVILSNIRNSREKDGPNQKDFGCQLSNECREAVVTILDDDHQGVFGFESEMIQVHENMSETEIKVSRQTGARGEIHVPYKTIEGSAKEGVDFEKAIGEVVFADNETEATLKIRIKDKEEYSRNETFGVELGIPKRVKSKEGSIYVYEDDFETDETKISESEKIALKGRPKLGSVSKCWVTIVPSREMKSVVDRLMRDTNMGQVLSSNSWKDQFLEAITISPSGDDEDGANVGSDDCADDADSPPKTPSILDYVMHFLTVFWKVLFAFIPPTDIAGGYACFVVSIIAIGFMTAVIGDLASHFGCTVGLKDAVTAISLVALGTSLPDTFASKTAACGDENADASVGNVTGSNAVNVFLGIGVAWSIAAIYHEIKGTEGGFHVDPGSLGFSVTVYCVLAVICLATLFLRRFIKSIGAELGGPVVAKYVTGLFFISLWLTYLVLSSLVSYCVIEGF